MLRAAYFGQELLSTFGTAIGEIALIPATGGLFTVYLTYIPDASEKGEKVEAQEVLLWDRKAEGGFPETKILKQRLRNYIEPGKDLGHSDKPSSKQTADKASVAPAANTAANVEHQSTIMPEVMTKSGTEDAECQDCK